MIVLQSLNFSLRADVKLLSADNLPAAFSNIARSLDICELNDSSVSLSASCIRLLYSSTASECREHIYLSSFSDSALKPAFVILSKYFLSKPFMAASSRYFHHLSSAFLLESIFFIKSFGLKSKDSLNSSVDFNVSFMDFFILSEKVLNASNASASFSSVPSKTLP